MLVTSSYVSMDIVVKFKLFSKDNIIVFKFYKSKKFRFRFNFNNLIAEEFHRYNSSLCFVQYL